MRIKTTFSLLCLVMLLLSVGVLDIHAIPNFLSQFKKEIKRCSEKAFGSQF